MLSQLVTRTGLLRSSVASRTPWNWQTQRTWTSYTQTADALTIHALNDKSFPFIWLRDSCQSSECIHENSKQKLHRSSDIPLNIAPSESGEGVRVTPGGIDIHWNDGHKSSFDQAFLQRHASTSNLMEWHLDQHLTQEAWTNTSISTLPNLFVPYDKIQTSSGLVDAITQVLKYGLLFVSGVPTQETANDTCGLRFLAERFSEIRPTFYGRVWDVIHGHNDSRNIAYTNLDLGLHMDLMYFQHPPRYQMLHCIRNRVIGGTNIFVDAFHVARKLQQSHPADFEILTKTPVRFHYVVDGHHLHREHFTIELAPPSIFSTSSSSEPDIAYINYSPPFQAPLPLNTPKEFFSALARFERMLNDPVDTYQYTLQDGEAVLFDNRRVLHSRTAFTDKPGLDLKKGETSRWLKGCFLEGDAIVDRARVLRANLGTGVVN